MSMLADRKRKQKWSLNPRGNEWAKDNNAFGKKLMERMGWTEGKGLGANEDGATEHIHVSFKNDSKGIGFKESIEWSHQQDNFSALLSELNNSNSIDETPAIVNSLEKKSEKSRARVHYKKFTRGKDLSRYSEKDLANILGRSKLSNQAKKLEVELENDSVPSSSEVARFGVNTTTGGSMVDYFKNKFPNFKRTSSRDKSDCESEPENNYGFGFYNGEVRNDINEQMPTIKKKRKHSTTGQEFEEISHFKKQKEKNRDGQGDGLINPAFDPLSRNVITSSCHVLETIRESDEVSPEPVKQEVEKHSRYGEDVKYSLSDNKCNNISKSKKNKKKKHKNVVDTDESGISNPCFNVNDLTTDISMLNENEVKLKPKKKRKHVTAENDGLSCVENKTYQEEYHISADDPNLCDSNVIDNFDSFKEHKRSKKRSRKCKMDIENVTGVDNTGFNEFSDNNVSSSNFSNAYEVVTKKLKKSKCGVENLCFNDDLSLAVDHFTTDSSAQCSNELEIKIKKKRAKHTVGIDNPSFTTNSNGNDEDITPTKNKIKSCKDKFNIEDQKVEIVETSIKLKSKRKTKMLQIENTCTTDVPVGIEDDAVNIEDCDLILNVTDVPVAPASSVKKSNKNVRFSKINTEYTFEDVAASPDDIAKRKELCDINAKVIEASSARYNMLRGLDNAAFNFRSNTMQEGVNTLTKSLENCQAEVENGINESKVHRLVYEDRMIGEVSNPDREDEPHPDGVVFRFKNSKFSTKLPFWERQYDVSVSYPKKSYKHLIKGDIVVGFKNTNLHKITGYGRLFNNKPHVGQ